MCILAGYYRLSESISLVASVTHQQCLSPRSSLLCCRTSHLLVQTSCVDVYWPRSTFWVLSFSNFRSTNNIQISSLAVSQYLTVAEA